MPSGSPKMTVRQGCDSVTADSNGGGTGNDVSCRRIPPPGGTSNSTSTSSTTKVVAVRRSDSSDFRNGNVHFRRSCTDLRPATSCCDVKMGRCDLRLGSCDVSLSTGDIILGTGEILRSNGEIYQLNGNLRTSSCQSLRSHSTLRRSRSSCLKGTAGDHRHTKTDNSRHAKTDNSHSTSSTHSPTNPTHPHSRRGRGRADSNWTSIKHKNLRNRIELRHSLNSASPSMAEGSEKVWCEQPSIEVKEGQHIQSDDVTTAPTEVCTNCEDSIPSTSTDVDMIMTTMCDVMSDQDIPALVDPQLDVRSNGADNSLCASSSLSSTSSSATSSQAPSSIVMTNGCENGPVSLVVAGSSGTQKPVVDSTSWMSQKPRPRIRRSQSDFLKSNRKLRRASVSIEDGNVKVIMHGRASTATSTSFLPSAASAPETETTTIPQCPDDLLTPGQQQTPNDDGPKIGSADDDDNTPSDRAQPEPDTTDDATPAAGSAKPREIPKWKQRPHPLIPDPERLSRPWWEAGADDDDSSDSLEDSRRNDREEIRRKLAMGVEEEYYGGERMYKKPNLQTRLQSGMNLQICFMNEATSDVDSVNGDDPAGLPSKSPHHSPTQRANTEGDTIPPKYSKANPDDKEKCPRVEEKDVKWVKGEGGKPEEDEDFFSKQAKLQDEARMALAQVRPMAHMQLEVEKQMRKKSPIAEMVGIPALGAKKKLSRYLLSEMNVAQLQVVVNDLHSQIETLNEELVMMLVGRDDLHMEQDSMLVDIEDHHRRALEVAAKVNKPKRTNKKK